MQSVYRREKAEAGLRERISQRISNVRGDCELTYARVNTNLRSYEQWEYRDTESPSPSLAQFHNRYKGERCFIVGNGPSLNRNDLSLLEGEKVFAVNSFYYKTQETGFRPTFFVVEDEMVMKENCEHFINYDVPFKFFPTEYRKYHPAAENVIYFKMNHGFYQDGSPYYNLPRFSADATKALYCGQSVTYINLQLAFFMGFSEVFLIGMDFDYVIPKEHKRIGNDIISTTDDPNHFHKDYFGSGKTWRDPKLDRVAINYRQAKTSYTAVGRKIYNATIGGKLEIFDRVDYEALLRDPKTGKKRTIPIAPPITSFGEGSNSGSESICGEQFRESKQEFSLEVQDTNGGASTHAALATSEDLIAHLAEGLITPETSALLLTSCASALLLKPAETISRLQTQTSLVSAIDSALKCLPEANPVVAHFIRLKTRVAQQVK